MSTELLGVALSEPGLGVLGSVGLGGAARVTYEAYLTNGFHDGVILDAPEGTRVRAGRGNLEDANASPAVVGRLAWSPAVGHEVGLSGHYGAYNTFEADGEAIDEPRMLGISKRGNRYLRGNLIHGARAVLPGMLAQETPLGRWARALSERAHRNVVVVALAAKLARIVWAVLRSGRPFDASVAAAAA